ncbi:MAG: protein-disulfide reductase DsbD family protein [Gemmatimonas sp.]
MRLVSSRTALVSQSLAPRGAAGLLAGPPLGLEFRLAPGWKTYWRSPGDAGLPAEVDWSGSENVADLSIRWPLPQRETLLGYETLVYRDRVVLPVMARPIDPAKPVRLRARVDYLVCEKLCVPADAALALDLAPPPGAPTLHAASIGAFARQVPSPASGYLSVDRAVLTEGRDGLTLEVTVRSRDPLIDPDLIAEGPRPLRFGRPRVEINPDRFSAVFLMPVTVVGDRTSLGSTLPFTFTFADRGVAGPDVRAVETSMTVPGIAATSVGGTLGAILLIAFAGGLLLNVMPCVLPVLSMKLLGAVSHAERPLGRVRLGFVATAAGIMTSMLVLAGAAIAARSAGLAVGWGAQFQSPVFLSAMALVLVLFALSLLGGATVALPAWLASLAGRGPREGLAGSFLAGAFATLLATPCTAPLLGTALGFALARGPAEILLVFAMLGLGLAAPYLAVGAVPALARRLPRPGPWMAWVRIALGLGLLATAAWLFAALAGQTGPVVAAASAAAALICAGALILRSRFKRRRQTWIAIVAAVYAAFVPLAAPWWVTPRAAAVAAGDWRPWDRVEAINRVAEGNTVYVHVTADWCLNCKVNKALVLDTRSVAERLRGDGVVAMIADWTRPDPRIGSLLASFGRYGIPFDVVYGPGAPAGIVLPEILTERAVLTALDQAGAPPASSAAR